MTISQQQTDKEAKFLDKLIAILPNYRRRQQELAEELGITPSHLSRLIKGEKASPTLENLVAMIHKETFSKPEELKESVAPYGTAGTDPRTKKMLDEWAKKLNIPIRQFVEEMTFRYGQKTYDDLVSSRKLDELHDKIVADVAADPAPPKPRS